MSSNSYVNLKIATCLVRYADDRLIDQRFLNALEGRVPNIVHSQEMSENIESRLGEYSAGHFRLKREANVDKWILEFAFDKRR
ncbi:hypothetical protein A8D98_20860 [Burkholderia cenocepacia]|nr:hypothetical protein A8D98_20860 [Burkholderia cenocepacia]ONQ46758.1 hypothetical protein A8D99_30775 [Burkholderia cenocepacia]